MTAAAAMTLLGTGCTHVMAQVDTDALSDSQTLEASAYADLADPAKVPMARVKVKNAYCSTHGALARSGVAEDAGIACPQ